MAVEKKRQLKPGPAGTTAERAHYYIRLMKQGFNNSEACRIGGVGRKTGSLWRNGRTVRDPGSGIRDPGTTPLLRQYFPKYSDLSIYSPQHLADVASDLNNRPRRILNDATHAQRFARLLNNHT